MTTTTVRFSTTEFEFAHGKKPRGTGGWAFCFKGQTVFFQGTFTEAKVQAAAWVKTQTIERFVTVVVGS